MRFFQSSIFPLLLGIVFLFFFLSAYLFNGKKIIAPSYIHPYDEGAEWQPPNDDEISSDENGDLIRYGKSLVSNTSKYLGPRGIVAQLSNGMNCQNCHIDAGTQNLANPFSAVASTYPKYRERSGIIESVEFRINDCMLRSLNGKVLDSASLEMRSIVAYLNWIGKDVPKTVKPKGAGIESLPYPDKAADTVKGRIVYVNQCSRCHGAKGEGILLVDSSGYLYPPLWGTNSFNTGAGIFMLSRLAGFIKNNMPYGVNWKWPQLNNEEAWNVAAFISSQQRPLKIFNSDWKNIAKKPIDFPFGPYTDSFSEKQHKYGPFAPMKK